MKITFAHNRFQHDVLYGTLTFEGVVGGTLQGRVVVTTADISFHPTSPGGETPWVLERPQVYRSVRELVKMYYNCLRHQTVSYDIAL